MPLPLHLYLHFPFCTNICSYCDFYKVKHREQDEADYYRALKVETELVAKELSATDFVIDTIFVGGGTPSLTNMELFSDWVNTVRKHFAISDNLEFSIECNPESIELDVMKAFKSVGITRPTFGLQSFDQKALTVLNRKHNVHQSHKAIYYANVLDFPTFGTDLIFGLPNQNTDRLTKEIEQLIDLEPPHISYYQLTVEEGTPLASLVKSQRVRLPDSDMMHALYRHGCDRFGSAGYARYEVSSFAKPGHECRHNLGYWTGNDYIGLGPAAHSFIDGERFSNRCSLADYLEKLSDRTLPREDDIKSEAARIAEAIMVGLRMTEGIDRARFAERYDRSLEDCFNRRQYDLFIESGHLIPDRGSLRLSSDGLDLADEIVRRLIAV